MNAQDPRSRRWQDKPDLVKLANAAINGDAISSAKISSLD
jgi:hypothetical protein